MTSSFLSAADSRHSRLPKVTRLDTSTLTEAQASKIEDGLVRARRMGGWSGSFVRPGTSVVCLASDEETL